MIAQPSVPSAPAAPPSVASSAPPLASPASALPPTALPPGWKPISTQSDKGYKLTTPTHTAYVKPATGGYSLLTHENAPEGSSPRDVDIHPSVLSTPHAAFALAHAKINRASAPSAPSAAWDGNDAPAGYSTVGGTSYLHQKTVGGLVKSFGSFAEARAEREAEKQARSKKRGR